MEGIRGAEKGMGCNNQRMIGNKNDSVKSESIPEGNSGCNQLGNLIVINNFTN